MVTGLAYLTTNKNAGDGNSCDLLCEAVDRNLLVIITQVKRYKNTATSVRLTRNNNISAMIN